MIYKKANLFLLNYCQVYYHPSTKLWKVMFSVVYVCHYPPCHWSVTCHTGLLGMFQLFHSSAIPPPFLKTPLSWPYPHDIRLKCHLIFLYDKVLLSTDGNNEIMCMCRCDTSTLARHETQTVQVQ